MEQKNEINKYSAAIALVIPRFIRRMKKTDMVQRQILTIVYYNSITPNDKRGPSIYKCYLRSKMWLHIGLGVSSEELETSLSRLKRSKLIVSKNGGNNLCCLVINEEVLTEKTLKAMHIQTKKLTKDNDKKHDV